MQEKTIFTISLVVTVLGLAFLFWYAEGIEIAAIAKVNRELPEEKVFLKGTVQSVTPNERVFFLKLEGERVEVTDVVLFPDQDVLLQEGDYVEIYGTEEEYKGKKEVVAQKVVVK